MSYHEPGTIKPLSESYVTFQSNMNQADVIRANLRRQWVQLKKNLRHPRTWFILTGGFVGALLIIAALTYVAFASALGSKESIVNAKNTGTILYDRSGKVLYSTGDAHNSTYITFDKIPGSLKQATVAVEDKDFYKHGGFDFYSILRSIYANLLNLDPTKYGGSTITQQLVRSSLLSNHKDFLRKYQEIVLSIEIERRYSKDEILEMYLNSVYYGANSYGVASAAQTYFGKDVSNLDLAQATLLAGLPNAPSYLSPTAGGDANAAKARQELILKDMVEQGYISQAQADNAKVERLAYQPIKQTFAASPHFALYVLQLLNDQYGEDYVGRAGLRVTTSLDLDLQQAAEKDVADQVARLAPDHATNGGLVAIDPRSGQILAMVGSADYGNDAIGGKLNIAFADRQPGSSFKPIVYLKAFESRQFTGASILHDVPTDFGGGYRPLDYDQKFRGDIPARYALAESLNIPSVELLRDVGVTSALEMAHRLKLSTLQHPDQYGLSLVLGGGEVKLFEMTRAYGIIDNNGNYVESSPILKIIDKSGNQIFVSNPHKENLVDPQYTYEITDILADSNAKLGTFGPGGVAALSVPGHRLAVKTGTTEHFRDAWTIGYSPNLVTGVWVGNNDGSYMDFVAGSLGPAPIWRAFMIQAEAKLGWEDFITPAGIGSAQVCYANGLLSHGTGPGTYKEVFPIGLTPNKYCDEAPPEATPSAEPAGGNEGKGNTGGGINVATPSSNPATQSGILRRRRLLVSGL